MTSSFFENIDPFLATAAKILVSTGNYKVTNVILASTVDLVDKASHAMRSIAGWDQDYTIHEFQLLLNLNSDTYAQIAEEVILIENQITDALNRTLRGRNYNTNTDEYYFNGVTITILNVETVDWRDELRRLISPDNISNQGRVRSDNIAPHEHQGLLFRSPPEIKLFEALKRAGLLFAPLPVFIKNVQGSRIEPDFVIFKDGITLIIEVDGRAYHREAPVDAQNRLFAFSNEGVDNYRVDAKSLIEDKSADIVVSSIIDYIAKRKSLRR